MYRFESARIRYFTFISKRSHAGEVQNPFPLMGDSEVLFGSHCRVATRTPTFRGDEIAYEGDRIREATWLLTMAAISYE